MDPLTYSLLALIIVLLFNISNDLSLLRKKNENNIKD